MPSTARTSPASSLIPYFSPVSFDEASDWLRTLESEVQPELVVAIARGALRFLQIFGGRAFSPNVPIVTQSALPYMDPAGFRGRRVLLLDDSVIFGSTMASVRDELLRKQAAVFSAAFVVDAETFFGTGGEDGQPTGRKSPHSTFPLRVLKRLAPLGIRQHHAALVNAVLTSSNHYNPEFPTFGFKGAPFDSEHSHEIATAISRDVSAPDVRDVTSAAGYLGGEYRYTLFLDDVEVLPSGEGFAYASRPKLRIAISPKKGLIQLTPIIQLVVPEGEATKVVFDNKNLNDVLGSLVVFGAPEDGPAYERAHFRLATSVAALGALSALASLITLGQQKATLGLTRAIFDEDLMAIFGPDNGLRLRAFGSRLLETERRLDSLRDYRSVRRQAVSDPVGAARLLDFIRNRTEYECESVDPSWEVVGKLFLALKEATDSSLIRSTSPGSERLEAGLSAADLQAVASQAWAVSLNDDEIDTALDYLVDKGLVVPKVLSQSGNVARRFYCGEDEDDQETLQLKAALRASYESYLKRKFAIPLDSFDMQKLSVVMRAVLPWLPLTLQPFKFGFVTLPYGNVPRVDWLTNGSAAPFESESKGGKTVLVPRRRGSPPVKHTWSPDKTRDFADGFDFVASVFARVSDDAKLLVSTCRTHRHTYNALAFELSAWCGFEKSAPGFGRVPTFVNQWISQGEAEMQQTALEALAWSLRYLTEIRKKHFVFYRGSKTLLARINKQFARLELGAQRWWQMQRDSGLVDNRIEPDVQRQVELLMSLSSQAERLTRIALHTLIRSGLNAAEEIESSLLRQGVRLDLPDYRWAANPTINDDIAAYNAAVDRGEVPGRSIFGTKLRREPLPNGVAGVEEVRRVMNDVTEAYSELREASKLYCPRYEGSEPEFPFLPRTGRRQLRDGSTETRREHVFMLTLDIVRGTNSSQTPIMKDIIREIFQALAARGLSFQDTGDDAFVAWSETPVVLWDAALAVALRGEDLVVPGERFAGTRKGIMYGQVAEVQKPSGEKFIRDIHIPNVINQAFYVLAGADTVVDLQERNRILAVEYQTYERLAVALRLKRRHLRVVKVAAKHFAGKCVLVPLRALRA